jgi:hypothetical protein
MIALALLQAAAETAAAEGIGSYALLFMITSMGAVTTLTVWCFWRILSTRTHFDPDGTGPAHSPVPGALDRRDEPPPA